MGGVQFRSLSTRRGLRPVTISVMRPDMFLSAEHALPRGCRRCECLRLVALALGHVVWMLWIDIGNVLGEGDCNCHVVVDYFA